MIKSLILDKYFSQISIVNRLIYNEYNIRKNILSHLDNTVLDDTVFNTLAGCFQMKNGVINQGRNLCRQK